jgi:hypothetical protein
VIRLLLVSHPRHARAVHFETVCGISSSVKHPAMIDVSLRHTSEEILFNLEADAVSRM